MTVHGFVTASATNFNVVIEGLTVRLLILVYECQITGPFKIKLSEEHQNFGWFEAKEAAKLLSIKYPKELTEVIASLD